MSAWVHPDWVREVHDGGITYRKRTPELGGQPRNPEADVIDEISRLVDWQLEKGKGW